MRIIGGRFKGKRIQAPNKLPVRPTTDFAKESLFNILRNELNFEDLKVLDLFSGTGNISYELASRGCESITALDLNYGCVKFIKQTARELELPIEVMRMDIFRFLKQNRGISYNFIFADPPYDHPQLAQLPSLILDNNWLHKDGWLILEHGSEHQFDDHPRLKQSRKYGHVHFSFFR